jgi:transglutaminase-like putative cysteine protease
MIFSSSLWRSNAKRFHWFLLRNRLFRFKKPNFPNLSRNDSALFGFPIAIQFLEIIVKIRAGYDIAFQCPLAVPMVLMLTTHPERDGDILSDQSMRFSPGVAARDYFDPFGNICTRLVAPPGLLEVRSEFVVEDTGLPDEVCPSAQQWDVGALPAEALPFLLASRYCDTEKLSNLAWSLFGGIQGGWQRAQAICDYAHDRIEFGYHHARGDRTASEGHEERCGVCRDFAHLAVTLSRCMNIPARYCTGYLGDIGVPLDPAPMDFSAWYEVFLDGRWLTLDARHNHPRIGRIVIAKGRDAADVAISTAFGPAQLVRFNVITDELKQMASNTRVMEAA